jgi:hypothetical protein
MRLAWLAPALLLAVTPARAAVLHFDDLAGNPGAALPAGYGQLSWTSLNPIHAVNVALYAPVVPGFVAAVRTPQNVAFNSIAGSPSAVRMAVPGGFDFLGAWWTSTYVAQTLTLEGRLGGALLYGTSFGITDTAALHVPLAWTGIDELVISGSAATYWAMDDFAYEPHPLTAVPLLLPASFLLSGLIALVILSRG